MVGIKTTRRGFLRLAGGAAAFTVAPLLPRRAKGSTREFLLNARPASAPLAGVVKVT